MSLVAEYEWEYYGAAGWVAAVDESEASDKALSKVGNGNVRSRRVITETRPNSKGVVETKVTTTDWVVKHQNFFREV